MLTKEPARFLRVPAGFTCLFYLLGYLIRTRKSMTVRCLLYTTYGKCYSGGLGCDLETHVAWRPSGLHPQPLPQRAQDKHPVPSHRNRRSSGHQHVTRASGCLLWGSDHAVPHRQHRYHCMFVERHTLLRSVATDPTGRTVNDGPASATSLW
jgi:hypothetical protein